MVSAAMKLKRCLLLGREAMIDLDRVLKKQRYHFTNKVCIVKAIAFPVVMYECESWTKKDYGAGEDPLRVL